jgi:hypothetical protein
VLFAELALGDNKNGLYRQIRRSPARSSGNPRSQACERAAPKWKERSATSVWLSVPSAILAFFQDDTVAPLMLNVDNAGDFQLLVQRIENMRGSREYFNRGD